MSEKEKRDLRSMDEQQMVELAVEYGEKPFRGRQMFEWIHKKQVQDLGEMLSLIHISEPTRLL